MSNTIISAEVQPRSGLKSVLNRTACAQIKSLTTRAATVSSNVLKHLVYDEKRKTFERPESQAVTVT